MKIFQRTKGWSHCICSTSVFFLFWQHACASLPPIRRWSEMHRSLRSVRGKKISTKAIILNCIKTEVNFSCSSVHLLSQQRPEVYICSFLGSASMFKSRWFRDLNHFFFFFFIQTGINGQIWWILVHKLQFIVDFLKDGQIPPPNIHIWKNRVMSAS